MKTYPYRNSINHSPLGRSPHWRPHPRYPSLYEDFEPFFRRNRRSRKPVSTDSALAGNTPVESHHRTFPIVRVIAALAIIVIMLALMAFA